MQRICRECRFGARRGLEARASVPIQRPDQIRQPRPCLPANTFHSSRLHSLRRLRCSRRVCRISSCRQIRHLRRLRASKDPSRAMRCQYAHGSSSPLPRLRRQSRHRGKQPRFSLQTSSRLRAHLRWCALHRHELYQLIASLLPRRTSHALRPQLRSPCRLIPLKTGRSCQHPRLSLHPPTRQQRLHRSKPIRSFLRWSPISQVKIRTGSGLPWEEASWRCLALATPFRDGAGASLHR